MYFLKNISKKIKAKIPPNHFSSQKELIIKFIIPTNKEKKLNQESPLIIFQSNKNKKKKNKERKEKPWLKKTK